MLPDLSCVVSRKDRIDEWYCKNKKHQQFKYLSLLLRQIYSITINKIESKITDGSPV